jgi:hypothetical protein
MMKFSHSWALRIIGFLLVMVVTDIVSVRLGLKYLRPRANSRGLSVYLYQRQRSCADVLLFGSSKTLRGLVPTIIEDELGAALGRPVTAFNLAQRGTGAFGNSLIMRDALASNGNPAVVVLELSPAALNANHDNVPYALLHNCSLWDLARSIRWLNSPKRATAATRGAFRGISNLSLYGHHAIFPHGLEARLERLAERRGRRFADPVGADLRLSEFPRRKRREMLRHLRTNIRHRFMDRYRIGGPSERGFREICRLTHELGIRLVVFNPPVTKQYRRALCTEAERRSYARYISGAVATYDFEYHDLDGNALHLTEDDFVDFGHLNDFGATKLSRHMALSVLAPLMRENSP